MRFCDKLAKLRKNNNLSQEQLAEMMNVSRQSISKWESGSTYPDMDKMLQLCKILDCKLDELMDDGVIGNVEANKKRDNIFNKILNTITKIYNMFCSMTTQEKFKCLLELFFIAFIVFILGSIINMICGKLVYNLLNIIPFYFSYSFIDFINSILGFIINIFELIIIFHLFKVRYLDYYIIDNKENNNTYIEPQKEKIIIRDSKYSNDNILKSIKKLIKICIKIFLISIIFPIMFVFLLSIFGFILSMWHINYGKIFVFGTILCLATSLFIYVIIEFIFKFIFNRTQNLKRLFIMFICSLSLIGITSGGIFLSTLEFKYVDENALEKLEKHTVTKYIDMEDDVLIFDCRNIEYKIDDSIDNIKFDINYIDDFDYYLYYNKIYEINNHEKVYFSLLDFNITKKDFPYNEIYNIFINDIKNKIIRNYRDTSEVKIIVTLSQKNYDKLKHNQEKYDYIINN